MKFLQSAYFGRNVRANVVLPTPFGPLLCRVPSDFLSYYPAESGSRCFLGHFAQEGLPLFARQELEKP